MTHDLRKESMGHFHDDTVSIHRLNSLTVVYIDSCSTKGVPHEYQDLYLDRKERDYVFDSVVVSIPKSPLLWRRCFLSTFGLKDKI